MYKNCQFIVKADFVTNVHWPCHLKVKMTRNYQIDIKNEFSVPQSVELYVLHMSMLYIYNKNDKVFIMGDGGHIWFGHDVIRGGVPKKHFGDFSCPGTH